MVASDSMCRCIGKIIARDLRLVASRLYRTAVTRSGSRAAVTAEITTFSFLCLSFPFCSGLSLSFHLSAGMKGNGGGAPPSSRLARRRRGYQVLSYSN